jgi:inorganic pyrophosphatase
VAQNRTGLLHLKLFHEDKNELMVVVETSKGSRNKYRYHEELNAFVLTKVLPAGFFFPFDFGFLPSTIGGDGDPLDAVIFMDEPATVGCIVKGRLVGVIKAEQTDQQKKTKRNDRFLVVCTQSFEYKDVRSINDLSDTLLDQVEYFFASYHRYKGIEFKPIGRHAITVARKLIEEGQTAFRMKYPGSK